MIRVLVPGAGGRMGSTLVRLVEKDPELSLAAVTTRGGQYPDLEAALGAVGADVVIDFTSPELGVAHAQLCARAKTALVMGTTGFNAQAQAELKALSTRLPLLMAPNTSIGVNVVIQMAAKLARALGEPYDVEIVELHHRLKKDAPSGTALKLAEEISRATGRGPEDLRFERHGVVGERPAREIGLQAVRGGDVVGEHTVFFFGQGERIELTHRATHRDQFGLGALRAAKWLVRQGPGLYGMADVLGMGPP